MNETKTSACSRCGADIPETVQYCPSCGAALSEKTGSERETLKEPLPSSESYENPPEAPVENNEAVVPAPSGLVLDWEPELVAIVEEAATLLDTSVDELIRSLVENEARKLVKKRRGMITLQAAADLLGATKKDIVQKINTGELIAHKLDGEWMVDKGTIGEAEKKRGDMDAQIELDLRELAASAGLEGIDVDGQSSDSVSATLCYVNQANVLVCPRSAWRKLGRDRVVAEAKDAVRRYLRRDI